MVLITTLEQSYYCSYFLERENSNSEKLSKPPKVKKERVGIQSQVVWGIFCKWEENQERDTEGGEKNERGCDKN